jgi:hypothetical protein
VENPAQEIARILEHLRPSGDDGTPNTKAALEATDRDKFREEAPDHMHRGRPGGWKQEWSQQHVETFLCHAGQELSRLGYV